MCSCPWITLAFLFPENPGADGFLLVSLFGHISLKPTLAFAVWGSCMAFLFCSLVQSEAGP